MDRRTLLKLTAGAGLLAIDNLCSSAAISQHLAARTLRFVPHADLASFDPISVGSYVARNAATLVWDMLYGVDEQLRPQRQMAENEEVSEDGLVWKFRLRPGLKFQDGEGVLARDAVASLKRWAARDPMGQMIRAVENELAVLDDRSFRWSLKRPFPRMLLALGKSNSPCCFIMPERVAATDPFKPIKEYIGSGPMRFIRDEWQPGSRAVFERFADYAPREEPASWLAGGKHMLVDRIEWVVMPDPATASAALLKGEVDWWEQLQMPDLVPILRKNRDVVVDIADPLGNMGFFRMNHLHPPFNDLRARRAILTALSQEDYMQAIVGLDDGLWKPAPSFFTPGTPLYNEDGGDILKGSRDLTAAKRLLAQSGYAGQPVTCLMAQDIPIFKAWSEVTADLLRRLGMNVDYVAADWGTVVARRTQKAPPGQGGWQMFHTILAGSECADPTNRFVRANGDKASFGWPDSQEVEAAIETWFDARTFEQEKTAARTVNKAALDYVVAAPLGCFLMHQAWRANISGIVKGPLPLFCGVSKAT